MACRDAWRDTPSRSEDCSDPSHPSGNDRSGGRWDSRGRGEDDPHFYRNYVARTAALNEVARKAAPPAPPLAKTSDGAAQRPLAAHSAPAHQSTSTPAKASDCAAQRRLAANTARPPPPHGRPDSLEHAQVNSQSRLRTQKAQVQQRADQYQCTLHQVVQQRALQHQQKRPQAYQQGTWQYH